MSAATQDIERSIRLLSVPDMVALHERLITTIHEVEDAKGLEPSFRADIERRVKSIHSGHAKCVDAFQALKKM